nr:PREDICTED: glutamate carboxypeptidase 2 homolog [Bos mutus]
MSLLSTIASTTSSSQHRCLYFNGSDIRRGNQRRFPSTKAPRSKKQPTNQRSGPEIGQSQIGFDLLDWIWSWGGSELSLDIRGSGSWASDLKTRDVSPHTPSQAFRPGLKFNISSPSSPAFRQQTVGLLDLPPLRGVGVCSRTAPPLALSDWLRVERTESRGRDPRSPGGERTPGGPADPRGAGEGTQGQESAETLKLNLRKFHRLQACEKLAPFRRIWGAFARSSKKLCKKRLLPLWGLYLVLCLRLLHVYSEESAGHCLSGAPFSLFGRWFIKSSSEATNIPQHNVKKAFLDELKAENIKTFLYNFTRIPHLAGTEQNFQLAKEIQAQWKEFGLDSVELAHYDVLLSYPNETVPNYISIIDEDGNEIFNTSLFEPPPPGYENVSDVVPPFSAFSPQGMPEVKMHMIKITNRTSLYMQAGDLVYVNYARTEDFFKLERDMKINCSGKILIARYGKIFRGNKVKNAQLAGARGIILYSDPADYFAPGVEAYPDGWNLPGGGVQRGNILNLNGAGDPLTPGYPANEYAYRREIAEAVGLPNIPVHPIGYYDAQKLLE